MEVQRKNEAFTTIASEFAHMLYREFEILPSGVAKLNILSTEVYNAGMIVDCSSPGFFQRLFKSLDRLLSGLGNLPLLKSEYGLGKRFLAPTKAEK